MGLCNLPSKNGKGDPSWQYDNRISGASLTSFSSVVLNVVLILYLFVEKSCSMDRRLKDVVRYVRLLYMIMGGVGIWSGRAPSSLRYPSAEHACSSCPT